MKVCSRTECNSQVAWFVLWNNPKLHSPDKIKTWGSCNEHLDYFISYLTIRGFFLRKEPAE